MLHKTTINATERRRGQVTVCGGVLSVLACMCVCASNFKRPAKICSRPRGLQREFDGDAVGLNFSLLPRQRATPKVSSRIARRCKHAPSTLEPVQSRVCSTHGREVYLHSFAARGSRAGDVPAHVCLSWKEQTGTGRTFFADESSRQQLQQGTH